MQAEATAKNHICIDQSDCRCSLSLFLCLCNIKCIGGISICLGRPYSVHLCTNVCFRFSLCSEDSLLLLNRSKCTCKRMRQLLTPSPDKKKETLDNFEQSILYLFIFSFILLCRFCRKEISSICWKHN